MIGSALGTFIGFIAAETLLRFVIFPFLQKRTLKKQIEESSKVLREIGARINKEYGHFEQSGQRRDAGNIN